MQTAKRHTKPPGWGLPGGRIDKTYNSHCGIFASARVVIFNQHGEVLLNKERSLPDDQERLTEYDLILEHLFQIKGSKIADSDLWHVLYDIEKIGSNHLCCADSKMLQLTAVKECLEETGLLIKPTYLTTLQYNRNIMLPLPRKHIVLFHGQYISGAIRPNIEVEKSCWFKLNALPRKHWLFGFLRSRANTLYPSHYEYLRASLNAMLRKSIQLPDPDAVHTFLAA